MVPPILISPSRVRCIGDTVVTRLYPNPKRDQLEGPGTIVKSVPFPIGFGGYFGAVMAHAQIFAPQCRWVNHADAGCPLGAVRSAAGTKLLAVGAVVRRERVLEGAKQGLGALVAQRPHRIRPPRL